MRWKSQDSGLRRVASFVWVYNNRYRTHNSRYVLVMYNIETEYDVWVERLVWQKRKNIIVLTQSDVHSIGSSKCGNLRLDRTRAGGASLCLQHLPCTHWFVWCTVDPIYFPKTRNLTRPCPVPLPDLSTSVHYRIDHI